MPPFGLYADPRRLAATAKMAEEAGWDGFFIWDHVVYDPIFPGIVPQWVALAAAAMQTTRIKLGVMVAVVARRRPWNLAREMVGVDQLSNGRLIAGVGLGSPPSRDFGTFHEEQSNRIRAEKLDEGLDILTGLWSGEPFSYIGKHYQIEEVVFRPTPVQRIPIWVGGGWDKARPMARAARHDGFFPLKWGDGGVTPDEWRHIMAQVNAQRTADTPYDWVHASETAGDDRSQWTAIIEPLQVVGVTWWIENVHPWRFGWDWDAPWTGEMVARMDERIQQGPPRI